MSTKAIATMALLIIILGVLVVPAYAAEPRYRVGDAVWDGQPLPVGYANPGHYVIVVSVNYDDYHHVYYYIYDRAAPIVSQRKPTPGGIIYSDTEYSTQSDRFEGKYTTLIENTITELNHIPIRAPRNAIYWMSDQPIATTNPQPAPF